MKDLKVLVRDYAVSSAILCYRKTHVLKWVQLIAKNALTILINISSDEEILDHLIEDDALLETILGRLTVCQLARTSTFNIHIHR